MPVAGGVFVRFSSVCRALVVGISGIAAVGAGQAATLAWTYRSPPECRGPSHGLESVHQQGVPRVVVFLGDSLVTGVGCTCQSNPGTNCIHGGPVLARRFFFATMGKCHGIKAARKLRTHRKQQRWNDKDFNKRMLGTAFKCSPFGGTSHAKGIVLEKVGVEAKQPNSAIRKFCGTRV